MGLLIYIFVAGGAWWALDIIDGLKKRISSLETSVDMLAERVERAEDEIRWLKERARKGAP